MTEVNFIRTHKHKWSSFEMYLEGKKAISPDEISNLYIQLTDDLSYARTHFQGSKLVDYLNQLTVDSHLKLHGTKRESRNRIQTLYLREIPALSWNYRRYFGYAALIFGLAIGLGVLSTIMNPQYTSQILGDQYVNMTMKNIEAGDPMAVYGTTSEGDMMLQIFLNNIKVSFYAFISGIFTSILTGLLLLFNGIMVGTFIYFFVQKGMFWIAFSTIFLHGAVELTCIILAGACGLILGNSLLFPKTYSRADSLKKGGRDALVLMLGVSPFVFLAAFIESFVTRHYLILGSGGRIAIILVTFSFIIWYFIIYPRKFKQHVRPTF